MPERVILIGADAPALNGVLQYQKVCPDTEAIVLYPELNPLPEFTCMTLERYLGRGIEFPETLRAFAIDTDNKRVSIRDNVTGAESSMDYDKLVFASGAAPADFDIPGDHLKKIIRVGGFDDAARLRPSKNKTVVIGNGLNLLLAVSVLMQQDKGDVEVIIHNESESTSPLSSSLVAMVRHHLDESGVTIHTDLHPESIVQTSTGLEVITNKKAIAAGRIVNATTSGAISYLAQAAGIETDATGGIIVDPQLRSSDPNVFACGGCASFKSEYCKKPIPGTNVKFTERRQAQVLASTMAGDTACFFTPISTYSVPFGDLTVSGAGLTVDAARECGFTPMSATVIQFDRAHFMPDAELMTLELVFDGPTRQVLGIQGLGKSGDALCGRISAVSALLAKKPTIDDIANLEIAYSPPFASAMDVLNTVANVADNMLAGVNEGIGAQEFESLWADRESNENFFLDCRELGNAQPFLDQHPVHWNHIPQGEVARRINEIPKDRKIILLCNTGARSYEAQVTLKHAGFEEVANVDGGMAAIKQSGVKV